MTGKRLLHYEVLEKLGEGGMGAVYKARDTQLDRLVAIKILSPDSSASPVRRQRFIHEAKAASALNHPNIVTIHQIGSDEGADFIVMEYLAGQTLDKLIARGRLPLEDILRYAVQVADGLMRAHAAGIVHRDLKPANVMVTPEDLVKILDFGLAKLVEPAVTSSDGATATQSALLTEPGMVMGTVAYMSPEQACARRVGARSDIFSFGALLYEMISGRRAFDADSNVAILAALLRDHPKPVEGPESLTRIVTRCLRKDPAERFQSMAEVREALEEVRLDQARAPASAEAAPSVAVLPFANLSPDKENEYFSDGLAEEILNALARIPRLRVTARTSAFAFRGHEQDIRTIGEALRVQAILEGSVRRAGNRILVTAQLVNTADGYQIWSERYDREITDVFEVQDEIAQAIAGKLRVQLTGGMKRHSPSLEAYDLYLRGRYHRYKLTHEDVVLARDYFQRALTLDPEYAPAYAGMAEFLWTIGGLGFLPPRETVPKAKWAAGRALELDPTVSEAGSLMAVLAGIYDYDWAEGARRFKEVLELDPTSPVARFRYSIFHLRPLDRLEEALAELRRALEHDPLSVLIQTNIGNLLYYLRRYKEAVGQLHGAIRLDPGFYPAHAMLATALVQQGKLDEAVASVESASTLSGRNALVVGELAAFCARAGHTARARELLAELEQRSAVAYVPGTSIACIYAGLGESDAAFQWLERAVEERDPFATTVRNDPFYDPLRADPRYSGLLARMGFTAPA